MSRLNAIQVLRLFDDAIDADNISVTPAVPVPPSSPPSHTPLAVPFNLTTHIGSQSVRRSTRIQNLGNTQLQLAPPQTQRSRPIARSLPAPPLAVKEPRRSARILKHRLEEAAQNEGQPPKSRRTKQIHRATTRGR